MLNSTWPEFLLPAPKLAKRDGSPLDRQVACNPLRLKRKPVGQAAIRYGRARVAGTIPVRAIVPVVNPRSLETAQLFDR